MKINKLTQTGPIIDYFKIYFKSWRNFYLRRSTRHRSCCRHRRCSHRDAVVVAAAAVAGAGVAVAAKTGGDGEGFECFEGS